MISISKKSSSTPPRPPTPDYPPPMSERQNDFTDQAEIEIEVFESEPQPYHTKPKSQQTPPTNVARATTPHRKSVSFDLSDNEYIAVPAHEENEPEPPDDIGELFLSQFSRENSHEDDDGYEVPIKYPSGPRSKPPKHVKSILRSPSPSSKAPTTLSSLDRPLRMSNIPISTSNVTKATVHTASHPSDEEIERENPFRKEFLGDRAKENIYEELDFEEQSTLQTVQITLHETKTTQSDSKLKQRPKSAYAFDESKQYTEVLSKTHQSSDNLSEKPVLSPLTSATSSKSTGSLLTDRPKQKPPLPPKPPKSASSIKSPPPVIKHADLKTNEALKSFQDEMLRGDLYEFVHNAETNQITKVKQTATSIPIEIAKPTETAVEEPTKESPRFTTFNPSSPLPPIPKANPPKSPTSPSYSKVYKRTKSVDRPTVSPPPPPVNMSTLPSVDKLKSVQTEDGSRVEILSTSATDLRKFYQDALHENASEYTLVTEETHREILLHENEVRNAMHQEQIVSETVISTSRIPVRKAPQPPTPQPPITTTMTKTTTNPKHSRNTSISSDVSQDLSSATQSSSAQVFPVTQILPVQYSHLPTPQQPDYFLAFPASTSQQNCNMVSIPQPGAFSTFMVSDNSAPQTTNIPTNIMCHPQQMPMYFHRPYISVPISTVHNINQSENELQGTNFINIHRNTGASIPTISNNNSNNSIGHTFNTLQSNYNQQHEQQQRRQQHYHYQSQSLLPCQQQDIHLLSPQSVTLDNNLNRNEHSNHDDNTSRSVGGSSSYSASVSVLDSQFTCNRNNESDIPVSSPVVRSSKSLTSISNSPSNYHSPSDEQEHTFTTFGKQTQV